jgi:uncharacterized membrane protein
MPSGLKVVVSSLGLCFMFLATNVLSQQQCGFQDLVIPTPAGTSAIPTALSDTGAIVGNFQSPSTVGAQNSGFLLYRGVFTHFRFPGSLGTFIFDINKQGVIVGAFHNTPEGISIPFMVRNGLFTKITLPGFPKTTAAPVGINELGHIVGQLVLQGNASNGWLLRNGELTMINFPGAVGGTFPTGINDDDVVVGTYKLIKDGQPHSFKWQDGNFTTFDIPGPSATIPVQINDKGNIAGTFNEGGTDAHGLLFNNIGHSAVIDRPGFTSTEFIAINSSNNVLGFNTTATGQRVYFKGFCSPVFSVVF